METKRQAPVLGRGDIFNLIQIIVYGQFLTSCNLLLLLALVPQRCSIQLILLHDVKILTVWCVLMGLSTSYRARLQITNAVSYIHCALLGIFMEILNHHHPFLLLVLLLLFLLVIVILSLFVWVSGWKVSKLFYLPTIFCFISCYCFPLFLMSSVMTVVDFI